MSTRKRVGILVYDQVKALDFIGPAEVFTEANQRVDGYETLFFSPDGRDVTTSMGLRVGVHGPATGNEPLDLVIIPGSEHAPAVYDDPAVSSAVLALTDRAEKVASICSGAFALAKTGLLDGRAATTHWKFTDALAQSFPAVSVRPDSIFVRDGNVYSSAGVAAGIDLALAIVEEDFGSDVARSVAQLLLVYMRRAGGQSQFSASVRVAPPRTGVARAVADYVASDPSRPTSLRDLAGHANVSIRHLNRVIRDEMGMTPTDYAGSMRLDLAVSLLEQGRSIAETARTAGYSSAVAFRRAFTVRYGATPSDYQKRFQTTGDGLGNIPAERA